MNTKDLYLSIQITSTSAFRSKQTGNICEVFNVLCFIFLMMVYFVEQNTFSVSYFRTERFINDEWTFLICL
jgi:hypothetical protein